MRFFIQGLTLGLAYVAPIGIQNIFVINSALKEKLPRAIITAIIVIFFDVSLALACFFGIGSAMERYSWLRMVISAAGSVVIIFIGIRLILSKSAEIGSRSAGTSIPRIISSAFAVTWLNPQAIIDGTMMLGAFHASLPELGIVPFITGVASASCMWFLCLSSAISLTSRHFTSKILRMINIICGVIITFYGIRLMLI